MWSGCGGGAPSWGGLTKSSSHCHSLRGRSGGCGSPRSMGPVRAGPGRGRHSPKDSNLEPHSGVASGRAPVGGLRATAARTGPDGAAAHDGLLGGMPAQGRGRRSGAVSASWGGGENAALCSWAGSPWHRHPDPRCRPQSCARQPGPGAGRRRSAATAGHEGSTGDPTAGPRRTQPLLRLDSSLMRRHLGKAFQSLQNRSPKLIKPAGDYLRFTAQTQK